MCPTDQLALARAKWKSKGFGSPIVTKPLLRYGLCLLSVLALRAGPIDASSFSSNAVLINFGDLTGGNCNLCGPAVGNQYAGLGVTFNNPTYPGADTADNNLSPLMFPDPPDTPFPNALYVYQGGTLGDAPASPFEILFSVPVTKVGFEYGSSISSFIELDAYSGNDQLLETLTFVGNAAPIGLEGYAGIEESTPIAWVDVSYHPDSDPSRTLNFSIDNLAFEGSAVAAPEPSTLALIGIGLLGMGAIRRRR